MERRAFLRVAGTGVATTFAGVAFAASAGADPDPVPFQHSVAAGDPLPDGLLLWTRVTPSVEATPGSGLGAPTDVTWEVATDPDFAEVIGTGVVASDPSADHTIKVDVRGLAPDTQHWYRFHALGGSSPTGAARTAPVLGSEIDSWRVGVVTCANWEAGYYSAYRHLAARDDLDYVLELGDYMYEYATGIYPATATPVRVHQPTNEAITLADYRGRYGQTRTDSDVQALHAKWAWIAIWDDHEVADNAWSDGAVDHTEGVEGTYAARKAAAHQAWFEWMPVRPSGPDQIYRSFHFGSLLELFMLDERSYRSKQAHALTNVSDTDIASDDPALDDPNRTILGAAQAQWISDGLAASTAAWKVLGNGVIFSPWLITPDVPNALRTALELLLGVADASLPIPFNPDQWDGYRASQGALRDVLATVADAVFLTGDVHSSWAIDVPSDPGTYPVTPNVAVEFVTPSITADSVTESLSSAPAPIVELVTPAGIEASNRWVKWFEPSHHGYGVFEVTAERAHYDWWFISDRADPGASAAFVRAFEARRGVSAVVEAQQLGPRTPRGSSPSTTLPGAGGTGGTSALPATGGELAPLAIGAAAVAAGALTVRAATRSRP